VEIESTLDLDAIYVARSKIDLHQLFYKYLNDDELCAKGSFIDHLRNKEHFPYKNIYLLRKRNYKPRRSFYIF
jgi:hypothetical protein